MFNPDIPILALTPRHVNVGDAISVAGIDSPVTVSGAIFAPDLTMDFTALAAQAKAAVPKTGDFAIVVSGFTPALLAAINAAAGDSTRVVYCLHWDSQCKQYRAQAVFTACLHG